MLLDAVLDGLVADEDGFLYGASSSSSNVYKLDLTYVQFVSSTKIKRLLE